tara:strand:- start:220 stop:1143 length:924 start_codon:yes stop_codon:yes gene_type:complete
MSLRNISNFFNIIKNGRVKSTLEDNDMIPVGTRDAVNKSEYQDTAITFKDLETQIALNAPQGPPGATGPAGAQGPQGIQGVPGAVGAAGLNFTGNWDTTNAYAQDDVAFFSGSSYVCTNAVGSGGSDPSVDTANWSFLALQGLQGPQGVPGSGFSASVVNRTGTGTSTSQVILNYILIPANTFSSGDVWSYKAFFYKGVVFPGGVCSVKIYISDATTLSGTFVRIATHKMAATSRGMTVSRDFYVEPTFTSGQDPDSETENGSSFQTLDSIDTFAIDWTIDQYLVITAVNNYTSGGQPAFNVGAKIY